MRIDPRLLAKARAEGRITERGAAVEVAPGRVKESEFTRQVIELARSLGWLAVHFRGVRVARKDGSTYWQTPVQGDAAGWPDLFLCRDNRVIVAELKCGTNRTSEAQDAWLAAFRVAGIPAYVWRPEDWGKINEVLS